MSYEVVLILMYDFFQPPLLKDALVHHSDILFTYVEWTLTDFQFIYPFYLAYNKRMIWSRKSVNLLYRGIPDIFCYYIINLATFSIRLSNSCIVFPNFISPKFLPIYPLVHVSYNY